MQTPLLNYNTLECLRNAYTYNNCQICLDICPLNAFSIIRNTLQLDTSTCNNCAGCIGGCPSEALSLNTFDPNDFIQNAIKQKINTLSCKVNTPCLALFDAHHFTTLALDSDKTIYCDTSECDICITNKDNKIKEYILTITDDFNSNLYLLNGKTEVRTKYYQDNIRPILHRLFNQNLTKDDRLNKVVVHTLRHTFGSQLVINGVDIYTVQKLMNHSDITMTMRYAKLNDQIKKDSVNKMNW